MLEIQKFVIPFILSIVFILTIAAPLKLEYKPFNEFPHKTATSNPVEFYSMEAHEQIDWDHGMNVFEWIILGGSLLSTTVVGIGFSLNDLFYARTILRRQEVEGKSVGEESTEKPLLKKNPSASIKTAVLNSMKEKQSTSSAQEKPTPESYNMTS